MIAWFKAQSGSTSDSVFGLHNIPDKSETMQANLVLFMHELTCCGAFYVTVSTSSFSSLSVIMWLMSMKATGCMKVKVG